MVMAAGFTVDEIIEFVHEYEVQRYGRKSSWLAEQGVSSSRMQRWRAAVVDDGGEGRVQQQLWSGAGN